MCIRDRVYNVNIKFMIDTGANVSLIDINMYDKIQKESKTSLPTLPISNIILMGATGRQNKTIKRQVSLEVISNGVTLPMIFLIAHNLPFDILIGCDILRKYSAVIDMELSKVTMKYEGREWVAELTGSKGVLPVSKIYSIRTVCDSPDRRWEVKPNSQVNNVSLLLSAALKAVSYTHLDVYKRQEYSCNPFSIGLSQLLPKLYGSVKCHLN